MQVLLKLAGRREKCWLGCVAVAGRQRNQFQQVANKLEYGFLAFRPVAARQMQRKRGGRAPQKGPGGRRCPAHTTHTQTPRTKSERATTSVSMHAQLTKWSLRPPLAASSAPKQAAPRAPLGPKTPRDPERTSAPVARTPGGRRGRRRPPPAPDAILKGTRGTRKSHQRGPRWDPKGPTATRAAFQRTPRAPGGAYKRAAPRNLERRFKGLGTRLGPRGVPRGARPLTKLDATGFRVQKSGGGRPRKWFPLACARKRCCCCWLGRVRTVKSAGPARCCCCCCQPTIPSAIDPRSQWQSALHVNFRFRAPPDPRGPKFKFPTRAIVSAFFSPDFAPEVRAAPPPASLLLGGPNP